MCVTYDSELSLPLLNENEYHACVRNCASDERGDVDIADHTANPDADR